MNLYLSRLVLNPRSRQVISELAHPYEMHRTLMRAFPKATNDTSSKARDEFGVLFRAEVDDQGGLVKVYVQSRVVPEWSVLVGVRDYLHTDTGTPGHECRNIMGAYRNIREGEVLSFRLRANPTKRVGKDGDALRGKRVELRTEEEQIAWLTRKGETREAGSPGGFALVMRRGGDGDDSERLTPCVDVRCEGKQTANKRSGEHGHKTTHLAIIFEGLLRVTNASAFVDALAAGIGSGKAFGFGLLSVARR